MRHRNATVFVALLIATASLGGKCMPEFPEQDPEITMIREILLLNNDVINGVDDLLVDNYDGSDEAFARLLKGVCVLETVQDTNVLAWKAVRIYELAKVDHQRRKADGTATAADGAKVNDLQEKILSYVVEVGRVGLQVYNIYIDWGKKPPDDLDNLLRLIGKFIGQEVQEPLPVNCSEAFSWAPTPQAA